MQKTPASFAFVVLLPILALTNSRAADPAPRTGAGLEALYDFSSTSGNTVVDRSGAGKPLNLKIADPKAVRWNDGALEVHARTLIRSSVPAKRIVEAVRRSGEFTIEAWIRPAAKHQAGPARIVTLSQNSNERNFTLGQDEDRFDIRFRTTGTSANGTPSQASAKKSLTPKLTHVVYTRDRSGRTRIYLDGKPGGEKTVKGATSNWNPAFKLALANELNGDRPWRGTYHLLAIYSRDLTPGEIANHFRAGAGGKTDPRAAALAQKSDRDPGAHLFETKIAPLFANRCLECHDSATHKGKLDLSRKDAALAGTKDGPVIVPGAAAKSVLWESISSDEMPEDADPLSPEEKALVKKWIDSGATWTLDRIDPAIYAHDDRGGEIWVQRLTVPEYIETVRSAVGVDIAEEARRILPPDLRADGFSNTAYNLNIDLGHVDAYAQLAEIVVSKMDVLAFAKKFSKSGALTDPNMRPLIADMGKWLLRGPLNEREVDPFRGISTTVASAGGNFEEAMSFVIEAMLQSPRFIYRMENQRGDGAAWPVGEYELASRLSYILWGGPPDEKLMAAAENGTLFDRESVAAQVRRMLENPRAETRSLQFVYEWLDLDRMDNLRPSPEKFPGWDPALAADMRDETLAFFKEIAWEQNRPLADLLNAQVAHLSPRLAEHYGLASAGNSSEGNGVSRYDLSSVPGRGGLLTQGSVLTVGGDEASMVTRGLFVLHDLLRGDVKSPPPDLDVTPVPAKPGFSNRKIAESRIADRSCGGCHSKFEPLAFGLEKFDGLGAYQDVDKHGNTLREDGEILFPGEAEPVVYKTSAKLMNLLAGNDRVRESIVWKVTQFALGRPLTALDAPIVKTIHRESQKDGGTYASLITAIVMSDLVQMTRAEPEKN